MSERNERIIRHSARHERAQRANRQAQRMSVGGVDVGRPPVLAVRGLSKRFGRVVTAEDITFEAAAGEVLGIVGPNGAGKSTLLNLVNGTLRPDAGTVLFDGRDVTGLDAASRSVSGVARTFQVPRPFGDMTVFENVLVGASFGGGRHRQAGYDAAYRAIETSGLLDLADVPAGRLRLLDRKRLELARALATSPRLLLLDEIAGGLTDQELPALVEIIRGLRSAEVCVIWIEHIVHALLAVVDRLMCLALGRVLAIGDPREVMADPRVIEVYLGSTVDVEVDVS
jgi:branched-chain amino acid transport system ATP-binding protein